MAQESSAKALADAVCEALKFGGLDALGNPQGLYSMLTDLADQTSPEMRALRGVLQESQDKRFLEPLTRLTSSSSARDVEVARLRMMHWLTDERLLAEGVSVSCAQGLAEGTARYLGIAPSAPEPVHAPETRPDPKPEAAPKEEPILKAIPVSKPQPAQAATPKPAQVVTPKPQLTPTPQPQPAPAPAQTPSADPAQAAFMAAAGGKKGLSERASTILSIFLVIGSVFFVIWGNDSGLFYEFAYRGIPSWVAALGFMAAEVGVMYLVDGTHRVAGCLTRAFGVLIGWTVIAMGSHYYLWYYLGWTQTAAILVGVIVLPLLVFLLIGYVRSRK